MVKMTLNDLTQGLSAEERRELEAAEQRDPSLMKTVRG